MDNNNLLRLIGLAKKAGRVEVGEEPAGAACRAMDVRLLLLSSDAAPATCRRAEHFAREGNCLLLTLPFSKAEIGHSVGREICAIAAVTDIGFACAIAEKLSAQDPQAYGDVAQRLALKAQRAQERRTAPRERKPCSHPQDKGPACSKAQGQASRRPKAKQKNPYANSRPVKRGKGSFRSKDGS